MPEKNQFSVMLKSLRAELIAKLSWHIVLKSENIEKKLAIFLLFIT